MSNAVLVWLRLHGSTHLSAETSLWRTLKTIVAQQQTDNTSTTTEWTTALAQKENRQKYSYKMDNSTSTERKQTKGQQQNGQRNKHRQQTFLLL